MRREAGGSEGRDTGGVWRRVLWLDAELRLGRKVALADLVERLECSRRTAINTVDFLRDTLGAPIEYCRERRSYRYTDATYALPSVFLREGELLALALAEEVSRQYLGTPLEAPLRGAIAKLQRYLPERAQVRLAEVAASFRITGGASLEAPVEVLRDLERAIRERRVLRMLYYTASRDETREREIEPHFLTNVSGDWTVAAWDRWRGEPREFMVARIREHAVLEERFTRREELEPAEYARNVFRTERGSEPYEVALRFDAYQARWIREREWHPSQRLEELADGGVVLRLTVSGEGDLTRWVLGYSPHVEVLSPEWLRERVAAAVRAAAGLYGLVVTVMGW